MLIKCFVHNIKPDNFYIFSKTASYDMTYRPVLKWLCGNCKGKPHIFEKIDMNVIDGVVETQKNKQKLNMVSDKSTWKPLDHILFLFDDCVGDENLKSH